MAVNFDDASSQYLIESSVSTNLDGATAMSVGFLLNQDDTAAEHKVIAQWNGNFDNSLFLVSVDTSGKIGLVVTASGSSQSSSRRTTGSITTGTWQHWLLTFTATDTVVIYKDGVSQTVEAWVGGSGVTAIGTNGSTPAINIGRATDGGYMDGKIAEVAMWTRALTSAEAVGLGKGYSPAFYLRNLFFYAPLVGRTSPEIEIKNGKNLTVTNAPANFAHPRIIYPTGGL